MKKIIYNSRRGKYIINNKYHKNIFTINKLNKYINKFNGIDRIKKLVNDEYKLMLRVNLKDIENCKYYQQLCNHPFWKKEDKNLLLNYINLYQGFYIQARYSKKGSKNIFSCNSETCISSLQLVYNKNKELIVYQRSCDLSLGYLADACTLLLFMQDLQVKKLKWYIGIPHIYLNNLKNTKKQFRYKKKIKMNFNVR